MSLKVYKNDEVQDFLKPGSPDLLFGIQISTTIEMLKIYEAYQDNTNYTITEVMAVKLNNLKQEISREPLSPLLINYNLITLQYDVNNIYAPGLDECIYFIKWKNISLNTFKTEPFLQKYIQPSILITVDQLSLQQVGLKFNFSGSLSVHWGDNSPHEDFSSGNELTHDYSSAGYYLIKIIGDTETITLFDADNASIKTITNLNTGVIILLDLSNNKIQGVLDLSRARISTSCTLINNDNLTRIKFASSGNILLSSFNVNDCNLTGILDLSNNPISGVFNIQRNPLLTNITFSLSGNGSLSNVNMSSCSLPNIDYSIFDNSDGVIIRQDINNMTAQEVDNQLINLAATGWINGSLNIAGTNAARTSASDTAYNSLITNGWSITVN